MNSEQALVRKEKLTKLLKMNISEGGKRIVERQLKAVNKQLSTLERWTG